MLTRLSYTTPTTTVKVPLRAIDGHTYSRLTKSQLAALAVSVLRGTVALRPTVRSVGAVLNVSPTYIAAAEKLSPDQLRQLRRGEVTLRDVAVPDARERFIAAAQEIGTDAALELLAGAERTAA
jgi:hypothetical protein